MKSVVIVTGSSLCHNPRAFKEASALTAAGYQVEILGAWLDAALKERDQKLIADLPFKFTPVLDVTQDKTSWVLSRLCVKAAKLWNQCSGVETRWQLGYTVGALSRAARRRNADLYIAHSEPSLWALDQLRTSKSQNGSRTFRIGVDMEDWFSEDLAPEARKQRPVKLIRSLERKLLCECVHSTCTSLGMGDALSKEYGCKQPVVIYNAFPWTDRQTLDNTYKDRRHSTITSLLWYSQTLGVGRGLEELVAALPHVRYPMEIHLRGRPASGFIEDMMKRVPEDWRSRIFIHPLVSNDELLSRIVEHDIGFAGELRYCRNKELTASNKILHYLLGGLAVVASDTEGQREIAAQAGGALRLYSAGDPLALAAQLNELLCSVEELRAAKAAALVAAEKTFCWERQVPALVKSVERALAE